VKLVSAYIAHTRPLIESDLFECLSGGIPIPMAVDLKAKHKDWNSRLTTARLSLLRDYADKLLLDLLAGLPNHGSLHTQRHTRCP
jgi:hypothetical protein